MPRKVSTFARTEQPIHWTRAFICGMVSASFMMGFMDIFYMLGLTPFSFEQYLGSLLRGSIYGHHNWTLGLVGNWVLGGVFGFLYAYGFEYVSRQSTGRVGTTMGLGHAVIAMVALFPFINILHQEVGTGIYPGFGFFGSGLGAPTPILLLMAHLLFGATMGTFYGPVRAYRVRARGYEPDLAQGPETPDAIPLQEHPPYENTAIYRVGT